MYEVSLFPNNSHRSGREEKEETLYSDPVSFALEEDSPDKEELWMVELADKKEEDSPETEAE